ncbi:PREDICTED: solute carrier family 13 member 2 isoform X2 [Hipposideros armiger]|uniref:Solute carrier family 13 member 2 isoform X2 n=1 Tax=Hipposideros armiger TaxID=186990 RepID=A0A8B7RTP2_HIPAR|nr:PREDICTED: solute carrier family 13 member 2 isoform X2 [Hipposideros armiger]
MATWWRALWAYRSYLIVWLLPIFLLPLPIIIATKEAYCGYAIILMALFWCTEALPLAVTALLPLVLFPMMNIMDASEVCLQYFKDTNILFIGGLLVAIAVEHWNLHKRIALRVLLIIGVRPALLMLGFMLVTAFLSMWISNTATTAMMAPIAHAVLNQLQQAPKGKDIEEGNNNPTFELQEPSPQKTKLDNGQVHPVPPGPLHARKQKSREERRFSQGMSLCVCYSASIGGIATLTGTTPNLVLQAQINALSQNANLVNFASWFSFAFPTTVILLLLAWLWLQVLFLGFNFRKNFGLEGQAQEQKKAALQVIQREHKLLGPMSFAEIGVTFFFILLVVLWFTREPGFFPGWADVGFPRNEQGESAVSDGTVAIFISLIMFIVPSKIPGLTQDPEKPTRLKAPPALLNWKTVNEKMPWNIVFLLGGGFALAEGSEVSGLSDWLGGKLTPLQSMSAPAIVFVLCLLVATFTECTSNVATTTLFLPILASMAKAICLHPLYVMLPCTLSASLAFMLPVATPPNAIIFSFGGLKVTDMARTGFLLNITGVLVIMLAINTWGYPIFDLHTFPSWAQSNATSLCVVGQANITTPSP